MRRHVVQCLTLLCAFALIALLLIWDFTYLHPYSTEVTHNQQRLRLACESGHLVIDNSPQQAIDALQRKRMHDQAEGNRRSIRIRLDREPYGSTAYREALADLKASEAAEPKGPATPFIHHSLPLYIPPLCLALVPLGWAAPRLVARIRSYAPGFQLRRRLFFSDLSLLLLLIVGTGWGRSYWIADQWTHARGVRERVIRSSHGSLGIFIGWYASVNGLHPPDEHNRFKAYPVAAPLPFPGDPGLRHHFHFLGITAIVSDGGRVRLSRVGAKTFGADSIDIFPYWQFATPYWFPTLLLSILPALSFRAYLKRRAFHPGHCPKCDYDLRATPGRCPECGYVVQPSLKPA